MKRDFLGSLVFGAILSAIAVGGLWLLGMILRENAWSPDAPRIVVEFAFLTVLLTLVGWKTTLVK